MSDFRRNFTVGFLGVLITALAFIAGNLPFVHAQNPQPQLQGFPGSIGQTVQTSVTATGTLTGAASFGIVTANSAGAITLTTDSAANLCAIVGRSSTDVSGVYWDLYVKQVGAGSVNALGAGTGVTVTGTATVATVNVRHFRAFPTNCTSGSAAVTYLSLETTAF